MNSTSLLNSLTADELAFIANRDYGVDAIIHFEALQRLISEQDGVFSGSQFWYPYEVIELGANELIVGHEREFAACTLLVLEAVSSSFDDSTQLDQLFSGHAQDYDRLPPDLRAAVLAAYAQAGC